MSSNGYSVWRLCFSILALSCISASVAGHTTTNITVSVPAGSSNHGLPNYICTPVKWYDIILFFGANFFAHAATIRTLPGEKPEDVALTVVLALFFPFSGISRGIEAIVRHASWPPCDDLTKAARAGALCTVVRGALWKLRDGSSLRGIQFENGTPAEGKSSNNNSTTSGNSWKLHNLQIRSNPQRCLVSKEYWQPHFLTWAMIINRKIHGASKEESFPTIFKFRQEYEIAILPSNTLVTSWTPYNPALSIIERSHENSNSNATAVSYSQNVLQVFVAIFQLIYAAVTVYRSRGDQIERFGYAAFGLTVLPYLVMSFVNLLGSLVTPTYPTLYLVRSQELDEMQSHRYGIAGRRKLILDGAVGSILQNPPTPTEACWEVTELEIPGTVHRYLWKIGLIPSSCESPSRDIYVEHRIFLNIFSFQQTIITIPAHAPFHQTDERQRWTAKSIPYWLAFSVMFLGVIPFAVIWAVTGFQGGNSSLSQRVFTMYWLATGLLVGALLPFNRLDTAGFRACYEIFHILRNPTTFGWQIMILLTISAPLGGFIVVGMMLREYGSCTEF